VATLTIQEINKRGGPSEADWPKLNRMFLLLHELGGASRWFRETFRFIIESSYPSVFQRIYTKPAGFAGDALTLSLLFHRTHGKPQSAEEVMLAKWDEYLFHQQSVGAIQHREVEVLRVMEEEAEKAAMWEEHTKQFDTHGVMLTDRSLMTVKDIACGWGLLPYALASTLGGKVSWADISYIGIDADPVALIMTKSLIEEKELFFDSSFRKKLIGIHRNLPLSELTWCSGLFDYFSDQVFVKAGVALLETTTSRVVIGNMSPNSWSIPLMELMGWRIQTRTKEQLAHLAEEIFARVKGVPPRCYLITQDLSGAQLYLHLYR